MFGSRNSELYVSNLEKDINEEILFNYFSRFGRIVFVKVMRHLITHESRGFAFVTFAHANEAKQAQRDTHNKPIIKNNIKVHLKETFDTLDHSANLIVSNLPEDMTEADLFALGEPFGPVFSVKLLPENDFGVGVRAYIQFENIEHSKKAIEGLNKKEYKGKTLAVESANRKNKVIVKGFNKPNIQEELKEAFSIWETLDIGVPEVSADKTQFICQFKFDKEDEAKSFLQAFLMEREKCKLTRPADKRSC